MDHMPSRAPEQEALKATTLLPILSAYFIAVGVLYLWGFWGLFGINVMEYLGLADVVKVAAWPVGSAFIFLLVGIALGETSPISRLPAGGGQHTLIGRWVNKYIRMLTVLFMLTIAALIVLAPPHVWQLVGVLVGMGLALPLGRYPLLVRLVPNGSIRSLLSFAAVVLPIFAFGQGRVNADDIRSGRRYFYVVSGSEGISSTGDIGTSMRYVGYAGDTFFFWEPSISGITLVPASTVKSLKLARTPKERRSLWDQLTKRD